MVCFFNNITILLFGNEEICFLLERYYFEHLFINKREIFVWKATCDDILTIVQWKKEVER